MEIETLMGVLFSPSAATARRGRYVEILELQMWRLSVLVCNKKIAAFSNVLAERVATLRSKTPLTALTQCMLSWERRALQCRILLSLANPSSHIFGLMPPTIIIIKPADFKRIYGPKMRTTLAEAQSLSPLCTSYTYQYVRREILATTTTDRAGKKKQMQAVNGEILKRVFISMPSVDAALEFVRVWMEAQKNASPQEATCMLECGTHDHTLRKWVLDVDASMATLEADGLIIMKNISVTEEAMNTATLQMASAVSHTLHQMGFLYRPCSFAVISRHSPTKMSWHITLHALASHEMWRYCIGKLDAKFANFVRNKNVPPEWAMYKYVDEATKRNSKGQYMQILQSTKVKPGCAQDGHFFRLDGIFDCKGLPLVSPLQKNLPPWMMMMAYAATSMVIHDPWSIPFSPTAQSLFIAEELDFGTKKRKKSGLSSLSSPSSSAKQPQAKKANGTNTTTGGDQVITPKTTIIIIIQKYT
jgi:hypothetical protein